MKPGPLINKHGGIDLTEIVVRTEYIDDRWLFYVAIPNIDVNFCVETFDLKDAIHDVALRSMEHMFWHLEDVNDDE